MLLTQHWGSKGVMRERPQIKVGEKGAKQKTTKKKKMGPRVHTMQTHKSRKAQEREMTERERGGGEL